MRIQLWWLVGKTRSQPQSDLEVKTRSCFPTDIGEFILEFLFNNWALTCQACVYVLVPVSERIFKIHILDFSTSVQNDMNNLIVLSHWPNILKTSVYSGLYGWILKMDVGAGNWPRPSQLPTLYFLCLDSCNSQLTSNHLTNFVKQNILGTQGTHHYFTKLKDLRAFWEVQEKENTGFHHEPDACFICDFQKQGIEFRRWGFCGKSSFVVNSAERLMGLLVHANDQF